MKLKVKFQEMDSVSLSIETKYEEIEKVIKEIEDLLPIIEQNWKGVDSDAFCDKYRGFISKSKYENHRLKRIYEKIDYCMGVYTKRNNEFVAEMRKDGDKL